MQLLLLRSSKFLCLCVILLLLSYIVITNYPKPKSLLSAPDHSVVPKSTLVFYTRVPKTASTSFIKLTNKLAKDNHFATVHITLQHKSHVLSPLDQRRLILNATEWTTNHLKSALFHGHFSFFDTSILALPPPVHIGLVREPLDRLLSYYYFLRHGDDHLPDVVRHKQGDTTTFDECVARGANKDCDLNKLWLQVPFFCGHFPSCWSPPGNRWALERAKANVLQHYLTVGVTEQLGDFLALLEALLPELYRGASRLFAAEDWHVKKTRHKDDIRPETAQAVQSSEVYKVEREFYDFVTEVFQDALKSSFFEHGSDIPAQPRPPAFAYDKVVAPNDGRTKRARARFVA